MRIGIIGGEKAGKSELARHIHGHYKSFKIIDNYVRRLSKRTETAFGPYATHLGNVQVAIERLNYELEAGADNFITCGTIIETLAYDALYGIKLNVNERANRARISVTMEFLGMMVTDTFLYDRLFYLPGNDEQLEYQIQYAIRLYGLKPTRLEKGQFDGVIEGLQEWERLLSEATKANEQGIRSSE